MPDNADPGLRAAEQLIRLVSGSTRPRIIVINPASGPGTRQLPSYQRAVEVVQKAGTKVLGYVPTGYGNRDPAIVKADIDRYVEWYGVDGIFLDEAAHSDDKAPLYQELSRHVRASGTHLVVINPGLVPARAYFELADIVVTFEGPFADYARAIRAMPAWVREIPSEKIAHIAYAASSADARELDASSIGAGYAYATNGVTPTRGVLSRPISRNRNSGSPPAGHPLSGSRLKQHQARRCDGQDQQVRRRLNVVNLVLRGTRAVDRGRRVIRVANGLKTPDETGGNTRVCTLRFLEAAH